MQRLIHSGRTIDITQAHLLAQEVSDLNSGSILLDDTVDGEMGVDGTHFVLEALDTDD